jgi:hypothetical protein
MIAVTSCALGLAALLAASPPTGTITHRADGPPYDENERIKAPADAVGVWEGTTAWGNVYVLDLRDPTRPYLSKMSFDSDAQRLAVTYVLGPITVDTQHRIQASGIPLPKEPWKAETASKAETISIAGKGTASKSGGHLELTISVVIGPQYRTDEQIIFFRAGYLAALAATGAKSRKALDALQRRTKELDGVRRALPPAAPSAPPPSSSGGQR